VPAEKNTGISTRLATQNDAPAILSIYNAEVLGGTNTFDLVERTQSEQSAWLKAHHGAHPAIVATSLGKVVAFGAISPFRYRAAYATTVEDSVYVEDGHRGQGIGRALLAELIRLSNFHGFHTMVARIVGHNEVSISLHEAFGFTLVGIEREVGRKHRQWLDVVELQLLLNTES
jgi:L-amino acid N-acyltransferase